MLTDAFRALGIEAPPDSTVIALGWATVDLDRAGSELGAALDIAFTATDGSIHLGCACRRSRTLVDGVVIVLLEPTTEGRLAATLARHGEGWAATWIRDASPSGPASGTPRSAARTGPLGIERLVLGGSTSGPHRLLVPSDTIQGP